MTPPTVRHLSIDDVELVRSIDRTEQVDSEYHVVDGALQPRPLTMDVIPPWDVTGDGPHSYAHQIEFCTTVVLDGAVLLGAFAGEEFMGLAAVNPTFEPPMAWLAFLHVTRAARRRGAATALWAEAAQLSRNAGATTMYVSATPTGSALGFYLRQGCELAATPHAALFAKEPDDVHLICRLT